MKLFNLQEKKAEKEGIATPLGVINSVTSSIDEIRDVVVVALLKDGTYTYANSHMSPHELVGLMEIGKSNMLKHIGEEQEGD